MYWCVCIVKVHGREVFDGVFAEEIGLYIYITNMVKILNNLKYWRQKNLLCLDSKIN